MCIFVSARLQATAAPEAPAPMIRTSTGSFMPVFSAALTDGIQHDDRNLALGLLLIVGVGRPELQRRLPQPGALLAGGGPGPRLHLRRPDLHFDIRIGEDVAVPARVLWRAALRGDHEIAVAGLPVEERKDELLARFPPGRRQQ